MFTSVSERIPLQPIGKGLIVEDTDGIRGEGEIELVENQLPFLPDFS